MIISQATIWHKLLLLCVLFLVIVEHPDGVKIRAHTTEGDTAVCMSFIFVQNVGAAVTGCTLIWYICSHQTLSDTGNSVMNLAPIRTVQKKKDQILLQMKKQTKMITCAQTFGVTLLQF